MPWNAFQHPRNNLTPWETLERFQTRCNVIALKRLAVWILWNDLKNIETRWTVWNALLKRIRTVWDALKRIVRPRRTLEQLWTRSNRFENFGILCNDYSIECPLLWSHLYDMIVISCAHMGQEADTHRYTSYIMLFITILYFAKRF